MSSGPDAENTTACGPTESREPLDARTSYRVVLEDIASGIETADSFAIKFSLLTKTPISKMKHVVRALPAPIWAGQGRARAEHVLALIEEAGGRGSIVETGSAAPRPATPATSASPAGPAKPAGVKFACRWCGFPMREDETRCGFCMTAIGDVEKKEPRAEPRIPAKVIPRKRLMCYAAVLVVGIMIIELFIR